MSSFAGGLRHERLVAVLVALLRRSCPLGGGGYGGSYELRLGLDEAGEWGGVDLIRSALRKAGRSLGWSRLQTFGGSFPQAAVAGVVDRREIPVEFAVAVEKYQMERGRAAAEVVGQTLLDGKPGAVPGCVFVVAQEFRAVYAEGVAR